MNYSSRGPSRGSALVELALVLPFMLLLIFGIIDIGQLVQTRLILTNVAREGGSIASRQDPLDAGITGMLLASGSPLNLGAGDGRVIVTRIVSGTSAALPNPTIQTRLQQGGLAAVSGIDATRPSLGLTTALYQHLVYNAAHSAADISSITVVEVYYRYRSITPLPRMLPVIPLTADGGGVILRSRAVF